LGFVVALAAATNGAAQGKRSTLVAGVADRDTGEPLEGAEVVLPVLGRAARANSMGEAVLSALPAGAIHLRVRRLGYSPIEVDVAVSGDTTGIVFRLERAATRLAESRVEAEALSPTLRDVATRRRQGFGRFLDDSSLAAEGDRDFNHVVTARLPGLLLVPGPSGKSVITSSRPELTLNGIRYCPVQIYLDDKLLGLEDQEWIRTWDLAAVEHYEAIQVPARYRSTTTEYKCGVLLLWSKPR
jgi:hypothetical protein